MTNSQFVFKPVATRRIPDPVFKKQFNTERHILVMNVNSLPLGISNEANARDPNIKKQVYKLVEESLLDKQAGSELGSFHLKNKGITIIAESIDQIGDNEYRVTLTPGQGIVDGGHTYKLITDHIQLGDLPEQQYVFVEIRTGIKSEWITYIAGGLNTGVQVQDMSLDELSGKFSAIKDVLRPSGICDQIAWRENDPGEFNARDIVSLFMMFNTELYKNDNGTHPVESYTSKAAVLKKFEEHTGSFNRMNRIMKDILELHDTINLEAAQLWNDNGGKTGGERGAAGKLAWMEYRDPKKNKPFIFAFIGNKTGNYKLTNGALYPILAAFRWYVTYDSDKQHLVWKVPFSHILNTWRSVGIQMLRATGELCDDLGNNPNALGKSKSNWGNMHNIVKAHDSGRSSDLS